MSQDLECPVFTAAWDAASEESRRKTLRSTATVRSSAPAAAPDTGNNCPVYACITPMRLLLQWEKVCYYHFFLGALGHSIYYASG